MSSPYVGILVNDKLFASLPTGKTRHEAIHYYAEAGQRYGLTPCFFRMQDVVLGTMTVHAYVQTEQGFIRQWLPVPKVVHNRAIYINRRADAILQSWTERGVILFNRWNRYSKLAIHQLLLTDAELQPHLPGTYPATVRNVRSMMRAYPSLIIKPSKSSIGRGVMKLERFRSGWRLTYPKSMKISNRSWRRLVFYKRLPLLLQKKLRQRSYIVQQRLPLATCGGRPFDLRVSVQRGGDGAWGVTGIVAKVAAPNMFLTNVAQGGHVRTLPELLGEACPQLETEAVLRQIEAFSLRVAEKLSSELPQLADLGLDIGISEDGFPLFIECNGKDQRYSFKEAGMLEEWQATYFNPIAYASYLLNQQRMEAGAVCTKGQEPIVNIAD